MDKRPEKYLDYSTSATLVEDRNDEFSNTFIQDDHLLNVEFARLCSPPGCFTCHGNQELEAHFATTRFGFEEVADFAELPKSCQIFYVGRKNSCSRLGISRHLFEEFCRAYGVFSNVWDFVLHFGFRSRGSGVEQAPCKFRQNQAIVVKSNMLGSFETAYAFSYAKQNGRRSLMNENPDYDPWSVRQVAVYQQYDSLFERLTFLLVAPSDEVRRVLEQEIVHLTRCNQKLNVFGLHLTILSTLHQNWDSYLRDLGNLLKIQSDNVMLRQVPGNTNMPDLPVTFLDRQRLLLIEETILDLSVVFESILDTLSKLKVQCQKHCTSVTCIDCRCTAIRSDFEDLEQDARLNLRKTDILHRRVKGTTQLLTNLLDFENAQTAHSNENLLNSLVAEAKDENAKMMVLAERSTRDAAAVRILTVITLIYLPMTVVASFFSSQLIRVNEDGAVSVVTGAWWFAVISLPLTAVTFLLWKFWLSRSLKSRETKMIAATTTVDPQNPQLWANPKRSSTTIGSRFMLALRNRGKREKNEDDNVA